MPPALLFHELAHHRQLGIPAFARHYVQGLLTHRAYERIPLEAHAFRVEAEVARLLNS